MKIALKRIVCIVLCATLLIGAVPAYALEPIDTPLTGETGTSWDSFENPTDSGGLPDEETEPDGRDSNDEVVPPDSETPENEPTDGEQVPPPLGASESKSMVAMAAESLSKKPLTWGNGNESDRLVFANTTWINSPMQRVMLDGKIAFCVEWNGMVPNGNYQLQGYVNDSAIKQIVANFDATSKSDADYMAAQAAIWAHIQGTTVASWGTNPGASRASAIFNGSADTSLIQCYLHFGDDTTQLLLTYENDSPDIPPEEGEGELRIEVESHTDTKTDVKNEKRYEYSDAIGQITIRKHDQDGNSLDGALFNIVVKFTDGSSVTVNNWEVDNGARLFTWNHPKDNHDPATVTVTEVVPPQYHTGDPTPKTAVVAPTYTRVTHVTTWTITIVTSSIDVAVIDIESGDVVASSSSSSSAQTSSDPQVEEFADFVEGDRETTMTFVNQRITGAIEVTKKDANTGQPLAGASIHLWGDDLGNPKHIDRTIVTGEDGIALFNDLPPGTYIIQETQPPFGYNLNNEKQTAVLQSAQVVRKEVRNYRKDGLVIKKVDPDGKPIAGAVFELRRGSGEVLLSETTNENGIIFRDHLTEGLYVIEEIKAPEGYLIDETHIKELFIYATDDNKSYTVTFVNKKKPSIEVAKVDADDNAIKLPGAVFRVSEQGSSKTWDITTGADGKALLENLEVGIVYVIEEIQPPAGYLNSGFKETIVLKAGQRHTVTVTNEKQPGIKIIKTDTDTGKPLVGALFRVVQIGGPGAWDVTTNSDGEAKIAGLAPGNYSVAEARAPDGYLLDVTPRIVTLVSGVATVVEIGNASKPGLLLVKLDKETLKPVAGAVFSVVFLQNGARKDLGTYTTGQNGTVFLPDLTPGNYIISETKAPAGYVLDPTPINFAVDGGKLNRLEVFNIPTSDLRLLKIDAESRQPLEGAVFKLFDEKRLEIGTYTTSALGEILVTGLASGIYFVQEQKAPAGYLLDNTVRRVELFGGKTTTVEVKNTPLGSLRITKVDSVTGKPLYGAVFLLYDAGNNLLGEYTTDQNGLIAFGRNLKAGSYKLKEIKAPAGYVLDETIRTITVKDGATTEIEVKNVPQTGNIQIVKVSDAASSVTKLKAGAALSGAVFEVYSEKLELVDKITTDKAGLATTKNLPLGKYVVKEVQAPRHYFTDGKPFYAEIKVSGDLVRFRVENTPEEIEVSIEKRGVIETMAGELIRYDFAGIANNSNCALEDFYWKDELPTDALRIQSINTGRWSERLTYDVWVKTNLKGWRRIKSNLHTNTEYTVDVRSAALGLASNEYVTAFKLEFGEVGAGFHATSDPFIQCRVNNGLPQGYRFTNRTDVGGRSAREWAYDRDSWTTVIYRANKPLPKTGF